MTQVELRVSNTTPVQRLAGAVAKSVRSKQPKEIVIKGIGDTCLCRAVAATFLALKYLKEEPPSNSHYRGATITIEPDVPPVSVQRKASVTNFVTDFVIRVCVLE